MRSIRRRLTLWLLAALGALVLVIEVALFVAFRGALVGQFDQVLLAKGEGLAATAHWDGSRVVDFADGTPPWPAAGPDAVWYVLRPLDGNGSPGRVLAGSPALRGQEWSPPGERIRDAGLPDGRWGRVATIVFRPPLEEDLERAEAKGDGPATGAAAPVLSLTIGQSRAGLDATLRGLGIGLVAAGLGLGAGIVAVVGVTLRRGLRPLDVLGAEVCRIGADSLGRRLGGPGLPRELQPVCARINELLARLEAAFDLERRFTGAAAHELRTPVAELRTLLEVTLSRDRSPQESRRALDDARAIVLHLERLVGVLFSLARHDSGTVRAQCRRLDPRPVLERVADRRRVDAAARGGAIEVAASAAPVWAVADEPMLEVVLENLIANAVEHGAGASVVGCAVQGGPESGGEVWIDVSNTVEGTTPQEVERFFEPFWRRSESRTGRGHLGLGLSLSRRIAEAMGGSLRASLVEPGRVRLRLTLCRAGLDESRAAERDAAAI